MPPRRRHRRPTANAASSTDTTAPENTPDQGISELISQLRQNPTTSHHSVAPLNHAKFGLDPLKSPQSCICGNRKFPGHRYCPDCALTHGIIDQDTRDRITHITTDDDLYDRQQAPRCQCGNQKYPNTPYCKPCAVQHGTVAISIFPGRTPCPSCGDAKNGRYAYCAGCAYAFAYVNADLSPSHTCPSDKCACGRDKLVILARCDHCTQPVRTVPTPAVVPAPTAPAAGQQNLYANIPPGYRGDILPCRRCSTLIRSQFIHCASCITAMGLPVEQFLHPDNSRNT